MIFIVMLFCFHSGEKFFFAFRAYILCPISSILMRFNPLIFWIHAHAHALPDTIVVLKPAEKNLQLFIDSVRKLLNFFQNKNITV